MPTILPQPKTQFLDDAGAPLAGGSVYTYAVGTSNPKTTWQDAGGVTANDNPVVLDSAGRALIWGIGQYRLVVQDATGVTVEDAVSSLPLPWDAALPRFVIDSGSINSLAVTLAQKPTSIDDLIGVPLYVQVGNTNTGATTINVSNFGPVAVQQGLAALVAGALVANAIYPMVYTGSAFQITGSSSSAITQAQLTQQFTDGQTNPTFGKVLAAESTGTSGGGYGFSEASNDTGLFSPSDGVAVIYSNGTARIVVDGPNNGFTFYNQQGTKIASLDANGNLICAGNVTAYGTPA